MDVFSRFRGKGSGSTVTAGAESLASWSPDEFERVLEAIGKALLRCREADEVDEFLGRSRELVLRALQARSAPPRTATKDRDDDDVVAAATTLAPCRRTTPRPRRCRNRRPPRDLQLDARELARSSSAGDPSDSDSGVFGALGSREATADSAALAAETIAAGRGKTRKTDRDEDPLLRFQTVGTAVASKKTTPSYLLMFDENGVAHSNSV